MKAFFVGDNRSTVNWGRGASLALREMLSAKFEIVGTVPGTFFDLALADAGFVGAATPPRFYGMFRRSWTLRSRWPFSWYMKLEEAFGAKDFIAEDPGRSVDQLLAYKEQYWSLQQMYTQAKQADVVIIDGDGDIVFTNPPRRQTLFILAMIELAVHLKKPVFVVNSMVSDCPTTGRNLATFATAREQFAKCQAVFLRDPESLEYVRKDMPKVKAKMVPDSLFGWFSRYAKSDSSPPPNGDFLLPFPEHLESWGKLKFSEPYVCIGGNALACTDENRAVACYGRLVDAIVKLGVKVYLTENDSPDSFLRRVAEEKNIGLVPAETPIVACGSILAHARLFVSGRYHPSILASLGGTPCIFLGSQGHKMRSISQVLEYEDTIEFNAFPSDAEIAGIVSLARGYLADGDARRQRIRCVAEDRYEQTMRLPQHLIDALLNSQTLVEKAALR